jgi:hypothetical protein
MINIDVAVRNFNYIAGNRTYKRRKDQNEII